jgi:hypothetical protein
MPAGDAKKSARLICEPIRNNTVVTGFGSTGFGLELPQADNSGMGVTMDKRRSDREQRSRFRSNRFFKEDGKWYFSTREGKIEGPFWELKDAEARLAAYIKIMNSGFMPKDSTLELTPLDGEKE